MRPFARASDRVIGSSSVMTLEEKLAQIVGFGENEGDVVAPLQGRQNSGGSVDTVLQHGIGHLARQATGLGIRSARGCDVESADRSGFAEATDAAIAADVPISGDDARFTHVAVARGASPRTTEAHVGA